MKSARVTHRITSRESESFKQYLNDIANIPMLTLEEETECALKAEKGDRPAIETLIKKNLRFVVSIAKQYETSSLALEDLVNEGNVGLVMAAERYNVDMGFRFITYAVYWIRKIIYEYISKHGKPIRIPLNKISSMLKVNNKINEMEQLNGRHVASFEALEELSTILTPKEIERYERYSNMHVNSLDSISICGEQETPLHELIVDDSILPPDYALNQNDIKIQVKGLLTMLKPRDRKIMIGLYGLDGGNPMTLEQVAEQVDLTREMVRQIRVKSLETLKNAVSHVNFEN